ncbi:MAG: IS1595 family transposase [bacterium]|nr:IS1595 family transposase [bacterium]
MDMYTLKQIPSEAQIRKYLRRTIYGKNVYCPECGSYKVWRSYERYRCPDCRIRFSLLSHTWLANMKLPLQQWWMLLWCWTTRIPILQTQSLTGLSEVTVRHWYDQFRQHLPLECHILERIVQMDEAYGRGWCLMMAKQIGSRKLAYDVLSEFPDRRQATHFLFQKIKPGSELWTDGAKIYQGIEEWWPVLHSRDIHKKFEFTHTSEIEGVFACLRTFIRRMYHHVTAEQFPVYVREFCFRFSTPELFESPKLYVEKTINLVPTR